MRRDLQNPFITCRKMLCRTNVGGAQTTVSRWFDAKTTARHLRRVSYAATGSRVPATGRLRGNTPIAGSVCPSKSRQIVWVLTIIDKSAQIPISISVNSVRLTKSDFPIYKKKIFILSSTWVRKNINMKLVSAKLLNLYVKTNIWNGYFLVLFMRIFWIKHELN